MKRKILSVLLSLLVLSLGLTGCGSKDVSGGKQEVPLVKVGIVQIVEHPSLDTIREAIIEQMEKEGYVDGETVILDYKNAQNDSNNLKTICQTFVGNGYNLIIAIATPSAQAALGETTEIPIIFSAVTDPLAAGLVNSLEMPGGNVTGVSDKVSAVKILDLALALDPAIKSIGALYSTGEVNSVSVISDLKTYAQEKNINVVEATIMNSSEIQQAAQSLVGKVDCVFSPIDNTVASAISGAVAVFNQGKIPYYVSADSMVADGGLATDGVDYISLGQATGSMVAKVLKGSNPGMMPVQVISDTQIYINKNTAEAIGIVIPETIWENAVVFD